MTEKLYGTNLNAEIIGNKALSLTRLHSAGFNVPPGFVVLSGEGLNADRLAEDIASIGGFPVAVRSSANLEDLSGASFAGQYQSYLNVASIEELIQKIKLCRGSANSEQAQAYLQFKGMSHLQPKMSVLVQKMVQAKWAGVAFTIHPLTGKEENALVECCEGLGEKLVSGHVAPAQYVLGLRTCSVIETRNDSGASSIPNEMIKDFCQKLLEIQAFFRHPQDVEWAIDENQSLFFLQSRPITRVKFRDDIDEFTNADFKDGGVSARVCTPLMYSLYREVMQRSMPEYFRAIKLIDRSKEQNSSETAWIDFFYGRPYWNASAVKRVLFKVPGFDEQDFDRDLGIQKEYGEKGPVRIPFNLRTLLPAIPVAIALEKEFKKILKEAPEFLSDFERQEMTWLNRISGFESCSDQDFFKQFREVLFEFYLQSEMAYFLTIYNNSNAQTEFKSFLRRMDHATHGQTEIVKLVGGLSEIVHMELQKDLIALERVAREAGVESATYRSKLKQFTLRHYFHGDAELELMTPRWGEVPERVTEMILSILKSGAKPIDPTLSAEKQKETFESEVENVRERMGRSWKTRVRFRKGFEKQLTRARSFLVERERMREASAKTYAIIRLYILEAARRWRTFLPKERDIFMLHLGEIGNLIDWALGDADARFEVSKIQQVVRFRELMYEGYSHFTPPNELGRGIAEGASQSIQAAKGGQIFQGLGCSPGIKEGRVRKIDSTEQMNLIQPGEILVTRFTDPGWTPILGLVQGVVTEVGGMLSHAAVIGREYGIPAVLNLKSATRLLSTGQVIRLDGTKGTVEILEN